MNRSSATIPPCFSVLCWTIYLVLCVIIPDRNKHTGERREMPSAHLGMWCERLCIKPCCDSRCRGSAAFLKTWLICKPACFIFSPSVQSVWGAKRQNGGSNDTKCHPAQGRLRASTVTCGVWTLCVCAGSLHWSVFIYLEIFSGCFHSWWKNRWTQFNRGPKL